MRHRKRRTRFGRQHSHRIATLKSLARSVLLYQRIKTTHTKAKEARRVVEKLITIAKDDSVAARRKAFAILGDRTLVGKLFKEIVPLFAQKHSGYTRIIPFNFRKGDGASIVFLELTEKKPEPKRAPAKKAKKPEKPPVKKEEAKEVREIPKAAPKITPKFKEEKSKGFLKKVRGFFRRKTNM